MYDKTEGRRDLIIIGDASVDSPSKGKDSEPATKTIKNLYLFTYDMPSHGCLSARDHCKEAIEAENMPEAIAQFMTPTDPDDAEEVRKFLNRIENLTVQYWCRMD